MKQKIYRVSKERAITIAANHNCVSLFTAPPLIPIYRNDRSNMSYLIDCKFFIKHTRLISISFHPDSLENHPQ